jgi:hypothetical protein
MKAQELRCKNYVTIYGNLAQIVPNDFVKWSDEKWEMKDIHPIPLTEEWFLKFGFRLWPWGWVKKSTDDSAGLRITIMGYFERSGDKPVKIEYVHQLQNLYSALTGEELTINQ